MSYIKIGDIKGECKEKGGEGADGGYIDWIDVDSFSWGATRMVGNAGGRMGSSQRGMAAAEMSEFTFTTQMDLASTKLALACANGVIIPEAKFHLVRSGGDGAKSREPYSIWKFTDVLITSYQTSGGREMVPSESISFSFLTVEHKFKTTDQRTGALSEAGTFNWNVESAEM